MSDHPHHRSGQKVRELKFSELEVQSIWNQCLESSDRMSAEDFEKAFVTALRRRAMLKLHLFSGDGLAVSLATGPKWASEQWFANEAFDGGIVLSVEKS